MSWGESCSACPPAASSWMGWPAAHSQPFQRISNRAGTCSQLSTNSCLVSWRPRALLFTNSCLVSWLPRALSSALDTSSCPNVYRLLSQQLIGQRSISWSCQWSANRLFFSTNLITCTHVFLSLRKCTVHIAGPCNTQICARIDTNLFPIFNFRHFYSMWKNDRLLLNKFRAFALLAKTKILNYFVGGLV